MECKYCGAGPEDLMEDDEYDDGIDENQLKEMMAEKTKWIVEQEKRER